MNLFTTFVGDIVGVVINVAAGCFGLVKFVTELGINTKAVRLLRRNTRSRSRLHLLGDLVVE